MLIRHKMNMNNYSWASRVIVSDMYETFRDLSLHTCMRFFATWLCFIHVSETCRHTSIRHVWDMSVDLYAYIYVVYNGLKKSTKRDFTTTQSANWNWTNRDSIKRDFSNRDMAKCYFGEIGIDELLFGVSKFSDTDSAKRNLWINRSTGAGNC